MNTVSPGPRLKYRTDAIPTKPRSPSGPSARDPVIPPEVRNPSGSSEPVIDVDPLRDMLNQSNVKVFGADSDTVPEEVATFMSEHDMGTRYFQVVLKRQDEAVGDAGTGQLAFIRSWYRSVPSLEFVVNNFGPGNYFYIVNWRQSDPETGKIEHKSERIPFTVSAKCQAQYDEYQRQRKIESRREEQAKVRQLKIDRQIDDATLGDSPVPTDTRVAAKEYLQEVLGVAKDLGLSRQDSPLGGLKDMLPLALPLITAMIENQSKQQAALQAQFNSMLTLMLGQADKSNQQLLEVVKASQGQGSGASAVKEFKDMVLGAIDLKEAINGDKESVADKIFGVIETVLPQIIAVSAQSKAAQAFDPRVALARSYVKTDPNFRQALADPSIMAEVVVRLDEHYGWEQTDAILTVAGVERPEACPRDPARAKPVDQRSTPTQPQQEVDNDAAGAP